MKPVPTRGAEMTSELFSPEHICKIVEQLKSVVLEHIFDGDVELMAIAGDDSLVPYIEISNHNNPDSMVIIGLYPDCRSILYTYTDDDFEVFLREQETTPETITGTYEIIRLFRAWACIPKRSVDVSLRMRYEDVFWEEQVVTGVSTSVSSEVM